MRQEREPNAELDRAIVEAYAKTFIPRFDCYSQQLPDGSYRAVHTPLTIAHVAQHLYGRITLGAYALDSASCARWICYDADDDAEWEGMVGLAQILAQEQILGYLEPSRRGGHLWLFFTEPYPGRDARRFARQLIAGRGLDSVEIYPKQDALRTGPGSLVRLPLGVHRRTGLRYHLIDLNGQPLAPTIRDQLLVLTTPERVPSSFVTEMLAQVPEPQSLRPSLPLERYPHHSAEDNVSDRIKEAITVYDFVSQFVDLKRGGRGLCPFHDDHRESLSVDQARNYWQCFAGCGGYTVIDFWMKWRNIDFKQAVKELAAMLL